MIINVITSTWMLIPIIEINLDYDAVYDIQAEPAVEQKQNSSNGYVYRLHPALLKIIEYFAFQKKKSIFQCFIIHHACKLNLVIRKLFI